MAQTHRFRSAVEARDLEALSVRLADDVEFYAPIRFEALPDAPAFSAVWPHGSE